MRSPSGWTAKAWKDITSTVLGGKRADTGAEARRNFIIGEQARLGGMVGLEDEYNTNHHDVLLWIDCHYTHDRTHTSLILGDEAAMQRLDKAFKEDTS